VSSGGPALGKRERTKQANRAAILEAARVVFAELGFGASSVRDIVRRTDLATGTFYNYFPDKESVLRALVEESGDEARARVRAARREGTTLESFVREGFRAYFAYLLEDREMADVLRRNAGTIRTMYDEPSVLAGTAELEEDLRDGIAAGVVPEHDTGLMAAAMVGAALEAGTRVLEGESSADEATALLATVFVAGLRALGR
jgi:AcrR family transcriptional regulator